MQGLSDELIRRLPQRVPLSSGHWKRLVHRLLLASAFGLPLTGFWLFWASNPEWHLAQIIISLCWAVVHGPLWMAVVHVIEPLLAARGLLPNVEYLPQDDQVILTDMGGFDGLFRPESRVVFYLGSLAAIDVREAETGTDRFWQVGIRTRKGDRFPIVSSARDTREQALTIAHSLAVMLSLPLE